MVVFYVCCSLLLFSYAPIANGQARASIPISSVSFQLLIRSTMHMPPNRIASLSDTRILFYGGSSKRGKTFSFKNVTQVLSNKNFDGSKPTVFYAHGYAEALQDLSVQTILKAYQKNGGYNILILDWSNLAYGNYLIASLHCNEVGRATGLAISKLILGGLNLSSLHLVGHSLGAHVMSAATRTLKTKDITVPRLTGLDPAFPGFYPEILGKHIAPEDATFVDIVHTDGGRYGTSEKTGRADFWPNGGYNQPGCTASVPFTVEDFCSHWRSWVFWAESLNGGGFLARPCENYDTFLRGACSNGPLVQMGINADSSLKGNFYLRTALQSPFGLAENGAA